MSGMAMECPWAVLGITGITRNPHPSGDVWKFHCFQMATHLVLVVCCRILGAVTLRLATSPVVLVLDGFSQFLFDLVSLALCDLFGCWSWKHFSTIDACIFMVMAAIKGAPLCWLLVYPGNGGQFNAEWLSKQFKAGTFGGFSAPCHGFGRFGSRKIWQFSEPVGL